MSGNSEFKDLALGFQVYPVINLDKQFLNYLTQKAGSAKCLEIFQGTMGPIIKDFWKSWLKQFR